ncbi:MAG: hypothetical protein ACREMK_04420 [Gemmatimonadota bacterium]
MKRRSQHLFASFAVLISAMLFFPPDKAEAQFVESLGRAAQNAAEAEARRQVRHGVRTAIRCAIGDRVCRDRARREGREVILVDEHGNPVGGGGLGTASWHLAYGSRRWNGDAGQVIDDDVVFALHLVGDEISLFLFLTDDDEGEHRAYPVVLALEDGERCRHRYESSAPFTVWLDEVDSASVTGAYEGPVLCEGDSAPLRTRGTFRIAR